MGVDAVLVENPPSGPAAWSLGLRALDLGGVVEVVPAATTVLVQCVDAVHLAAASDRFAQVVPVDHPSTIAGTVTIAVTYDGADLAEVADRTGLSPDDLVELHTSAGYTVAFCGFAPGFAYLTGLPERLHLPRRKTPRTRVPAGSLAVADRYAAVYPRQSPGGWHLLGSTARVLFDLERDPPTMLEPGTSVRFEALR